MNTNDCISSGKKLTGFVVKQYVGLGLGTKLILGFMPLSVLLIVMSLYTLFSFERINTITSELLDKSVAVISMTETLESTLIDQERYGRRFLLLKKSDAFEGFWKKGAEFKDTARTVDALYNGSLLEKLHDEYEKSFKTWFDASARGSANADAYEKNVEKNRVKLFEGIRKAHERGTSEQKKKTGIASSIGQNAFYFTATLCIVGIVIGIGAAVLITNNVSASLAKLRQATKLVSEGKFTNLPALPGDDDFGKLSESFVEMGKRLKHLEETNLDASPLTRLPGGLAIESMLKERISYGNLFSLCYFDIDNFKAFNDKYGYAKGSELIVALSNMICTAIRNHGAKDDFIGHVGGDDFVMITIPERHDRLCTAIIKDFDTIAPTFYSQEDREKGYITGLSRQGVPMTFPIVTISIAVITNAHRKFTHHLEVGEVAAEVKKFAKSKSKSNYVVDKRTHERRHDRHLNEDAEANQNDSIERQTL